MFANPAPGRSQEEALAVVERLGKALPPGYILVLGGASVTFRESGSALVFALIVGILVAYMVLASQFNSYIDPITVLTILPLSIAGAAWALATDQPTAARDVSTAKALASDAARLAGRHALQCHGAIGYTVEYDLHLYLKRAEALARWWGDAAWHRDRVGVALGI